MLRDFVERPRTQTWAIPRRIEAKGAVSRYTWDFAPSEAAEGITVSAVAAESSDTGVIGISGAALAASMWSGYLTAVDAGTSVIKLTATTSGSQVIVRQFIVEVVDPALPAVISRF